jgi:hypothetical protein
MPSEIIEPPARTPHPDDPEHEVDESETAAPSLGKSVPATSPLPEVYSDSSDELSAMLAMSKPDPNLGTIEPEPAPASCAPEPAPMIPPEPEPAVPQPKPRLSLGELSPFATLAISVSIPPVEPACWFDAVGFDAASSVPEVTSSVEPTLPPADELEVAAPSSQSFDAISALEAAAAVPVQEDARTTSPVDPLGAIDLSAPPASSAASKAVPERAEEEDDEEFEDDDHAPRGPSLAMVLLASYASAAKIGLIWVVSILWKERAAEKSDAADDIPVVEAKPDPGRRAANSRPYVPPAPLAAEKITTLGQPIRLGGIEATAVAVSSGSVRLKRSFTKDEERNGGEGALKLRLRLRNVSKDSVFAPLDEAFVREREAGVFDSFIELGEGEVIDMFPLSVYSEWSIDGQEFKELKPGETLNTEVVSAAGAVERKSSEMIWRIRLRTGIDKTDTLGVRFKDSEIRTGR